MAKVVCVSGVLLASMFDEAHSQLMEGFSMMRGLLFGDIVERNVSVVSDTEESARSVELQVSISDYSMNAADLGRAAESTCIGMLMLRKDGLCNPSFRDIHAAQQINRQRRPPATSPFPLVLLVVSVNASGSSRWIYGQQYTLFGLSPDRYLHQEQLNLS